MSLSILTNPAALVAQQAVNLATAAVFKTETQLATGLKIVTAADNPAGYYLAAQLNANVTQYTQVGDNIANAAALGNIAMAAADEEASIINTCMWLALDAMNTGGNTTPDYTALNNSYQAQLTTLNNVANLASYNQVPLANTVATLTFQTGINAGGSNNSTFTTQNITENALGLTGTNLSNSANATAAYAALQTALNTVASYGSSAGTFVNTMTEMGNYNTSLENDTTVALGAVEDVDYAKATSQLVQERVAKEVAMDVLTIASNSTAAILQLMPSS